MSLFVHFLWNSFDEATVQPSDRRHMCTWSSELVDVNTRANDTRKLKTLPFKVAFFTIKKTKSPFKFTVKIKKATNKIKILLRRKLGGSEYKTNIMITSQWRCVTYKHTLTVINCWNSHNIHICLKVKPLDTSV